MNKIKIQKIIPYALAASLVLSGCGKKSDCDIPTWHAHKYTKSISQDITLSGYFDDEHLERSGYHWSKETIDLNENDKDFYRVINQNGLIDGKTNWDYLYHVMSNNHDYLVFYYEYTTVETYTTTDSDGNISLHSYTVHHDGWHKNAKDSDNTGATKVCHHRYYAYKIVLKNGEWVIEESPLVDDIREVLDEYPYITEECYQLVKSDTYNFNRSALPYLKVEEITPFKGPELNQTGYQLVKE